MERFLDAVLSIQEHIDPYAAAEAERPKRAETKETEKQSKASSPFDDLFSLAPVDGVAKAQRPHKHEALKKFPARPEKDIMRFIMENSRHLEPWQRDVIGIVRQEMLYFVPQMQTKICNEGWASLFHARIMRELDLTDEEFTDYATLNAGVVAPNPHSITHITWTQDSGDIERRWDNPTEEEREKWGRKGDEGREKLFEVRAEESDVSLIRNYLTEQLVEDGPLPVRAAG